MTERERRDSWSLGRPINGSETSGRAKSSIFSRFMWFIFAVIILGAGLGAGLWMFFKSDSFPKLAPGRYAGTLTGLADFGVARDWVLTISDDFKSVDAIFLGQDGATYSAQRDGSGFLIVSAAGQTIVFKGSSSDPGDFRGTFHFLDSRRSGLWSLRPIELASFEVDPSFRTWMLLRAEIAKVDRDISIAQTLIPAQKLEIEELSRMITDESALAERGARRMHELEQGIERVRSDLATAKKEVAQGEAQLKLAQRVSLKGKLVSLARESLEREARWARSLLAGSLGAMSTDLEEALKRAEEIRGLKEALARERQSVEELSHELANRGT